jgi:glycerol dehydrogenase-like iron-containing ADH family enzyme
METRYLNFKHSLLGKRILEKKPTSDSATDIPLHVAFDSLINTSFLGTRNAISRTLAAEVLTAVPQFRSFVSDNVFIMDNLNRLYDYFETQNIFYVLDKIGMSHLVDLYPRFGQVKNFLQVDAIKRSTDLSSAISAIKKQGASHIVGIGGGKTQDYLKFLGYRTNKAMIAIPTHLATHAYASNKIHAMPPIANLGYDQTIEAKAPHLSLLDYRLLSDIEKTNKRLIYSGFGDMMAFLNGKLDWMLSISRKKAEYSALVESFIDDLLQALEAFPTDTPFSDWIEPYVTLQVLLCHITLWAGSAPASGAEHLFAKCMATKASEGPLHGELVALGVLIFYQIRNKSIEPIADLMDKYYISRSMGSLGVQESELVSALTNSLEEGVKKNRYTILNELDNQPQVFQRAVADLIKKGVLLP